jgi:imidazolonepropionase-like amidohydrolase
MVLIVSMALAADPNLGAPATLAEAEARGMAAVETQSAPPDLPTLIDGATVMTAAGEVFSPGWIAWKAGRILGVGAASDGKAREAAAAALGAGVRRIDGSGKFVTPGLIDTHSHLGVYPSPGLNADSDGNEMTAPTTPGVWAEHSVWPQDPGFQRAIAGGVTTLQVLPGSANLIGGRGVILHNAPARGSRAMRLPGAPETVKLACGENPKRVYKDRGGPQTRMGNLRGHREAFLDAEAYRRAWRDYEAEYAAWKSKGETQKKRRAENAPDRPPKPPDRDLDKETLVGILDGRLLPQIHCYRADDMLSMLQVAREFGFHVRGFHHALEAYKIRDVLASEGVSVSTWADWWGFKEESWDGIPENAAMVTRAGARAVIHSDSEIGIQRLNQEAAKAMASGNAAGFAVSDDDALRWITANAAWTLGIDADVGTLSVGKRADVVIWDRTPFSVYASAQTVFVDGVPRYDRSSPGLWSDFSTGVAR